MRRLISANIERVAHGCGFGRVALIGHYHPVSNAFFLCTGETIMASARTTALCEKVWDAVITSGTFDSVEEAVHEVFAEKDEQISQLLSACKSVIRDLQMEADPEAYWVKQATSYLNSAIATVEGNSDAN
jgi:hypothetical protein